MGVDAAPVAAEPRPLATHRERMLAASGGAAKQGGATVQGGATKSFPIDASVGSVLVFLQTEGRNLDATIEVLQGPDCVRQARAGVCGGGGRRLGVGCGGGLTRCGVQRAQTMC